MKRIAAFFLALQLPAALPAAKGVFREYRLPAAGARPTGIAVSVYGEVWFTQFGANKIGRISQTGQLMEYSIPTPNSGPLGITTVAISRDAWFTEFNGNKIGRITAEGVITEFPIPTPGSAPYGITGEITDSAVWFTELNGNKLGRISPEGLITEFAIPTPDSLPMGISRGPWGTDVWFTESRANKIGWMFREGGTVTEIPIPTPSSGPAGITMDSSGRIWFTESNAGRIGRIARPVTDLVIEEFTLPDRESGPVAIDTREDGTVWFTERFANRIGRIDLADKVVEYPMANAGEPSGIVGDRWYVWFTDRATGKVVRMVRDAVVLVGAGVSGSWDTEYRFANPNSYATGVTLGVFFEPNLICSVNCPQDASGLLLPTLGTGTLRASQAAFFLRSLRPVYVRSSEDSPATVTARVLNTARPSQGIEIPAVRLSTLWELKLSVLVFPGASRGSSVHGNLVLSEVGWDDAVTVLVEALSPDGVLLGDASFQIVAGSTLFLVDVLAQLGVAELDGGQIRVTRTAGDGLMWGLLATVSDDGQVTVSLGMNP